MAPEWTRQTSRSALRSFNRLLYGARTAARLSGLSRKRPVRSCTLCGVRSKFRYYGDPPRFDAMCPACGSLERDRLVGLWAQQQHPFDGKRVLHFAPEPAVADVIRTTASLYRSADLRADRADLALNLESVEQPSDSWDVVVAGHVLEHVNDNKALRELRRILRPGGVAVLTVPMVEGWETTYEDHAVTSPAERELHFGQADHVRWFGRDFRDRIIDAGFRLTEFVATGPECVEHGLTLGERVFLCWADELPTYLGSEPKQGP